MSEEAPQLALTPEQGDIDESQILNETYEGDESPSAPEEFEFGPYKVKSKDEAVDLVRQDILTRDAKLREAEQVIAQMQGRLAAMEQSGQQHTQSKETKEPKIPQEILDVMAEEMPEPDPRNFSDEKEYLAAVVTRDRMIKLMGGIVHKTRGSGGLTEEDVRRITREEEDRRTFPQRAAEYWAQKHPEYAHAAPLAGVYAAKGYTEEEALLMIKASEQVFGGGNPKTQNSPFQGGQGTRPHLRAVNKGFENPDSSTSGVKPDIDWKAISKVFKAGFKSML